MGLLRRERTVLHHIDAKALLHLGERDPVLPKNVPGTASLRDQPISKLVAVSEKWLLLKAVFLPKVRQDILKQFILRLIA